MFKTVLFGEIYSWEKVSRSLQVSKVVIVNASSELENIQIYELLSLSPKFSSLPDYVLHTEKHC